MGLLRRNSLNIGSWLSSAGGANTTNTTTTTTGTGTGTVRNSFGSSVAVQKLRESKWFDAGEERVFCAVIENGFIVEVRQTDTGESWFGVATIETKKSLKPTAENVKIYSVRMKDNEKKPMKVYCVTLPSLWQQGYQLRINNVADRTKKAHPEKDILAQIKYASKCQMVFHNSQHFSEFCRYGDRPQDSRKRQISDCAKWGGINIGATLIYMEMQKKSKSASH
ncbi:uncharacterized protein LOC131288436 [Anopheles ziemanni]|uniref:uncharacterized protein LOC131260153 n=1 Tax=Anopheles coustani TaxID=139045 RepID=UPI002657FB1F|nr:uncharacterized protein LOC131260153 [Anopheles coustani]XP_058173552.1 uncharacterized protein LOC131288436 [Anopheles ziemanni]